MLDSDSTLKHLVFRFCIAVSDPIITRSCWIVDSLIESALSHRRMQGDIYVLGHLLPAFELTTLAQIEAILV